VRRGWWLVIVVVVVLAGCDAPTRPEHTERLRSVEMAGVIQPDGAATMHESVVFPSSDGGTLRLGAPTLGSVDGVRVDGSPRSGGGERVDVDPRGYQPQVDWVVHGSVERYPDAAIVTLPIWTPPKHASGDDLRVAVSGTLQLPEPPIGTVRWHGASPATVTFDGSSVRFSGAIGTTTPSELTFLLPSSAIPGAPLLAGGSRVASYESRQASADAADAGIAKDLEDRRHREDLEANLYWTAVGLEVAIPFLVTFAVLLGAARVRRRAGRDVPDELSDPPSDLPPAAVALLHAGGTDIGASAIASTILDLHQRGALIIEGVSGERYTMRVVGASGRAGEASLLQAMTASTSPVSGPPLPVAGDGDWWRLMRRDVVAIARDAGLLRRRYPSGLFISAVIALALTTLPLYARSPEMIVAGTVVASILAAIPFVGGYVLTSPGHRERARWEAYRRHLAAGDLGDVGAAGIVIWGTSLGYAAALGVATTAVADLSPAGARRKEPALS
jgi:hypothetical protein